MKMQNLLTGTRNSHGSILKVVMDTNEVTVTLVDVVWKKITKLFTQVRIKETWYYLVGHRISFILGNNKLFHLVHCTDLTHLLMVRMNTVKL